MKAAGIAFLKLDKVHSLMGSALLSLGRLGATVVMARVAGVEDFAQFILLVAASVILLNVPNALLLTPMINRAGGFAPEVRDAMILWTHRRVGRLILGSAGLAFLLMPLARVGGISLWVYGGVVFAVLSGCELQFQRSRLQARFKTGRALIADALSLITLVAGLSAAVWWAAAPLAGFWWGMSAGQMIAIAVMRSGAPMQAAVADLPPPVAATARRDGFSMLGGSLANSAGARLQPFVLAGMSDAMTVAAFGAAWTLIGPIRMLSAGLSALLRPRLALLAGQGDERGFDRMLRRAQALIGAAGLAGVGVTVFVGEWLVVTVMGEALAGIGLLVPLALLYGTVDALTSTQMIALQIRVPRGSALATRFRIESAVLSLLLLVPACYFLGASGALLGLLVAEIAYGVRAGRALQSSGGPGLQSAAVVGEIESPSHQRLKG